MDSRYRQYMRLNRNVLLGLAASIAVSAVVAQALKGEQDYLNTTYTLIADYVVYFSTFGGLYYLDNRKKYAADRSALRTDLIKIISSLGIAEAVYTVIRWVLQYYLLTLSYDPYIASIVSQAISTSAYMAVLNLGVKITRLYRE